LTPFGSVSAGPACYAPKPSSAAKIFGWGGDALYYYLKKSVISATILLPPRARRDIALEQ